MTDVQQLSPMPDDWERALAIVAHPDDMEYGASSAVAGWTDAGKSVAYLLVTRGEAGIDTIEPEESARLRVAEQRVACDAVGVTELEFLDHPDGVLTYGLPLRRDLAAAIRRHRPELVITLNHRESFAGGGLNMADHRVVGEAVIDAVRDAGNRWVFTELFDEGLEPWSGVRWVAVSGSPLAGHAVDITATLDRGIASLAAHHEYLAALGPGPMSDPAGFLRTIAENNAPRFGGRLATTFELLPM
ncbi:PIG-L deacetylase family protein [Desertimonas flava]|uniref:PIG-L deacetylase family protein n=1 Tax=Desertimonas flava TaxID=2064846 RepID=UPI000E34D9FB|nr:PIG-L deacetylase family protein [Desertimonas flava]